MNGIQLVVALIPSGNAPGIAKTQSKLGTVGPPTSTQGRAGSHVAFVVQPALDHVIG